MQRLAAGVFFTRIQSTESITKNETYCLGQHTGNTTKYIIVCLFLYHERIYLLPQLPWKAVLHVFVEAHRYWTNNGRVHRFSGSGAASFRNHMICSLRLHSNKMEKHKLVAPHLGRDFDLSLARQGEVLGWIFKFWKQR